MYIEQLYTGCLAEAAYYIESEGEAAIIDPLRETEPYLKKAAKRNSKIKYIFETHFHADFVSGHVDLSSKTGAPIIFGPNAETGFKSNSAKDGEEFQLGKIKIKVLHTPGHTLESTTFLLIDEEGKEKAIFTGDTLFIGDVGRPDLAIDSGHTKEELAGMLYDSLHQKIMTLPDGVIVYPAHGAGSACGKNMSKETTDTLGHQKQVNYALKKMSKQEFVKEVLEGILPAPVYFPFNAQMNKEGYANIDEVKKQGNKQLSPEELESYVEHGALLLDTRKADDFHKGYIPGAVNIGLEGQFAPWVGALIRDIQQPIVFIADQGKEEEVVTRLARVGYDHTMGYLKGGMNTWITAGKPIEKIASVSAKEMESYSTQQAATILDVRRESEYEAEHLINAINLPLDNIDEWGSELDKNKNYYIHCAGGYRSMITSSILKNRGFENITNIAGGFSALKETNIPKTDYVCPTTLNKPEEEN
jgi:hydroxyacylglutathione hydrolase